MTVKSAGNQRPLRRVSARSLCGCADGYKKGGAYLDLTLADKTKGDINCKYWDWDSARLGRARAEARWSKRQGLVQEYEQPQAAPY